MQRTAVLKCRLPVTNWVHGTGFSFLKYGNLTAGFRGRSYLRGSKTWPATGSSNCLLSAGGYRKPKCGRRRRRKCSQVVLLSKKQHNIGTE